MFATGLFHVVECRSEDGPTYCFLCHCCRIRSNNKDIIDHLTSSSHLMNYLVRLSSIDNRNEQKQKSVTMQLVENMVGLTFKFNENVCVQMETHPEQVELMRADVNENHQLLQSLAKKVEQEEGIGELKVSYLLKCTDYSASLMLDVKLLSCSLKKKYGVDLYSSVHQNVQTSNVSRW